MSEIADEIIPNVGNPGGQGGAGDPVVAVLVSDGDACRIMEGPVSSQALRNFDDAHLQLSAQLMMAKGVDAALPEVTVEEIPPEPLGFEGRDSLDSKMRLWGLHPQWGQLFRFGVKMLALFLDVMTVLFRKRKSRVVYSGFFRWLAFVLLVFAVLFAWGLGDAGMRYGMVLPGMARMAGFFQIVVPGFMWCFSWVLLVASFRLQNGRSFLEAFRPYYDPVPAFEAGPVITIGDLLLSLKDTHTNMLSFGGIGSGKCWAPGTEMLMFDGTIKRVEDIKAGDMMMGPDSKPRKVLGTTKGRAPMHWISERGAPKGGGFGCNDVHLLTLKHKDGRPSLRRRRANAEQSKRGLKKLPWFQGLHEVSGFHSFGINERTGGAIRPQDIADVELKGFLERTPEECRKGYSVSRFWKLFRVAVDFEESRVSRRLGAGEYYRLGQAVACEVENKKGPGPRWRPDIYLQASMEKRRAFLAGWLDCSAQYIDGSYLVSIKGEWRGHFLLLVRSLGYVVRVDSTSTVGISSGRFGLAVLPVKHVSRGRRGRGFGDGDPLCYDWKVEETGEGEYHGFTLDGDGRLLLADCTVTHNTAGFINPTLLQFFRKLNDPSPYGVYSRWGGMVLDVKGDFIDFVIYCFKLVGRPLVDLVIIDPDIDLVRYNPLDPSDRLRFAENGAGKLRAVQKIIGGGTDGKDKYWDDTSERVIASALKVLQVLRATPLISLADVGRYIRDDDMVAALIKETEARLARDRYQISEEEYFGYRDAINRLRTEWVGLSENTKSILKTTISGMLGPIVGSVTLQKVFCRETTFSFKQSITEGKIVLFRGSMLDKNTRKLLAVCLKMDFQDWARRRNGATATQYGLDREGGNRTILFVCDEYQEYVTAGANGDEEFYGVSRSCKVCCIAATQHVSSLYNALGNENQTTTLMNNLCTKVFMNTPDPKTGELGEHLGGKFEMEKLEASVDTSSVLGKSTGGSGSTQVRREMRENFRKDRFANLVTMDMEKSADGPWYSEAFVYHYNNFEPGPTKMFEARLMHCYPPRGYMARASLAYDVILRDRNAQRAIMGAQLGLQAHADFLRGRAEAEFNGNRAKADASLLEGRKPVEIADDQFLDARPDGLQKLIDDTRAELKRLTGREAESKRAYLSGLEIEQTSRKLEAVTQVTERTWGAEQDLSEFLAKTSMADESYGAPVVALQDGQPGAIGVPEVVSGPEPVPVVEDSDDMRDTSGEDMAESADDFLDGEMGGDDDAVPMSERERRGLSLQADETMEELYRQMAALGIDPDEVDQTASDASASGKEDVPN